MVNAPSLRGRAPGCPLITRPLHAYPHMYVRIWGGAVGVGFESKKSLVGISPSFLLLRRTAR